MTPPISRAPVAASAPKAAKGPGAAPPPATASAPAAPASAPRDESNPSAEPPPPAVVSGAGQRIYERSRPLLLQVRTLLKTQDSQSSVGSGFLVTREGHLVTNYHVISQYALQPKRHRLVYATIDGKQGALQLLAFDVVHDLALLKAVDPAPLAGRGTVNLAPEADALARGARIFSLGNPLDVGFAVAEGTYNGQVERSFLPTLFFGGSLSPGMSGGPALDEHGRLVGVNVATRRDGEQVSFLVPAAPVRKLLARGRAAAPIIEPAYPEITRQLLEHETDLSDRFIAQSWRNAGHARYAIPVPQELYMRCWGHGSPQAVRGLQFERSDCEMDSRVFINGALRTGYITVRHEAYDGSKLGALRFAERYSASFQNEFMGANDPARTAPRCVERNVDRKGLPLRAVICVRAYKKLEGLHDLSVLVATLDGTQIGVQGRLDALGVSFANAQRLAQHYLDGYAWIAPKTGSR
ncbi:S1 family peptidase [Aquabacterium sp.]|uniref:S1 family peptidase n=1 Tax=Aquabacterium sp. TaxID=1872578 RepID=UPI002CF2AB44|nr:serine protease [Aquabacterium sp.]HSW08821.1 serine protease [Aquabacterium sp.]